MMEGEMKKEEDGNKLMMVKREMCRRFRRGVCVNGSNCDYAHSVAELRCQPNPKLCRLFLRNKHCHYGRTCRFLHSHSHSSTPQPEKVKVDGQSYTEPKRMRTCAAAPSDDHSSQQHSCAATNINASTTSFDNNQPSYPVKFIFKNNQLQKISRIYADWI